MSLDYYCPRTSFPPSFALPSSCQLYLWPRMKTATAIQGRLNPRQAAKIIVFHQINFLHYNPTYRPSTLQITELIILSSLFIKKLLSYCHYPLPNCQIITTSSSSIAKSLLSLVSSLLCKS